MGVVGNVVICGSKTGRWAMQLELFNRETSVAGGADLAGGRAGKRGLGRLAGADGWSWAAKKRRVKLNTQTGTLESREQAQEQAGWSKCKRVALGRSGSDETGALAENRGL